MNSQQPLTVDFLKRQATRIKKALGIRQHQGLDLVVQEYGYANWRHFLNSSASQAVTVATAPHAPVEPPTFAQWLAKHIKQDSPLGDLAQDAARDEGWPSKGDLQTYRSHLTFHGAAFEAQRTLNQAWKSYRAFVRRLAGTSRGDRITFTQPLSDAERFELDRRGFWLELSTPQKQVYRRDLAEGFIFVNPK